MMIEPSIRIFAPREIVALEPLPSWVAPGTLATCWRAAGTYPQEYGGRVLTEVTFQAAFAIYNGRPNTMRLTITCQVQALDLTHHEFQVQIQQSKLWVRRVGPLRDKHYSCWTGNRLLW